MLSFLWDLASFIVALGVLITVHEFGHFWVARRCGVRVERFSIGFGKALWRRTDKLGTEYVIALIPLGGYVKMLDERAANQNFLELQAHLEGTAHRIAVARTRFNDATRQYNVTIRRFPANLIAGMFGFDQKAYFAAEEGAQTVPEVKF